MSLPRNPSLIHSVAIAVSLCVLPQAALAQTLDREDIQLLLERPLEQEFIPGQAIVKLHATEGIDIDIKSFQSPLMQSTLGGMAIGITSGGEIILSIGSDMAKVQSVDDLREQTLATIQMLRENPQVEYAEPNYILQIQTEPNDPKYREQWHYFEYGTQNHQSPGGIGLPDAWDYTKGDSTIVVAVLDTGILSHHRDIASSPNLLPGFDMISHFGQTGPIDIANDGDGRDEDPTDPGDAVTRNECGYLHPPLPNSWHGTHVAGTVGVGHTNNGTGVAGVAWRGGLLPVRVLGKCGGATNDIIDGIRWAAGFSVPGIADNPNPARVINLSLGGRGACSNSYQRAISDVVNSGVTVVVAAGNVSRDAAGYSPASCHGVVTVGASDLRGYLARYSNFGDTVEILAPGGDIYRDDNGDNNNDGVLSMVDSSSGEYARYNGTSMAAPHVSGVVALMLAIDSDLSPTDIMNTLQSTARRRSGVECPRPCGAGLLNASAAITAVR